MDACFHCNGRWGEEITELYGYPVCDHCKGKLGLFQDHTIKGHAIAYEEARDQDLSKPSYEDSVVKKLETLEKNYIRAKIKLLYILDRLTEIR